MLAEVHDRAKRVKVPGARSLRGDAEIYETTVLIDPVAKYGWNEVYASGILIGRIRQTHYTYSPRAAGFGGRIARYHREVKTWHAESLDSMGRPVALWRGKQDKGDPRMHSRQAALAFLLLAARSPAPAVADPFRWAA